MRAKLKFLLPIGLLGAMAALNQGQTTRPSGGRSDASVQPAKVEDGVRSIVLPAIAPPELPQAAGYETYFANCIICHTPRYVTMQPAFPRKVWQAEVEKMKKVYGAPIADDQIPAIVDYLVAVRGK